MPPTSPPPADPSRPGRESHASGDEDDVTERRSLLAPDPNEANGPGAAAAAAAAVGRPGGAALYIEGTGRHHPICGGQCLWVRGGDDACDMAWVSALVRSSARLSAFRLVSATVPAMCRLVARLTFMMVVCDVARAAGAGARRRVALRCFA